MTKTGKQIIGSILAIFIIAISLKGILQAVDTSCFGVVIIVICGLGSLWSTDEESFIENNPSKNRTKQDA